MSPGPLTQRVNGLSRLGLTLPANTAILQLWAAFVHELATGTTPAKFAGCATPAEAHLSHRLFTAALESAATGATGPVHAP